MRIYATWIAFYAVLMFSGVFRILAKGGHGERAEREPITGVWGRSPQRGPGDIIQQHIDN